MKTSNVRLQLMALSDLVEDLWTVENAIRAGAYDEHPAALKNSKNFCAKSAKIIRKRARRLLKRVQEKFEWEEDPIVPSVYYPPAEGSGFMLFHITPAPVQDPWFVSDVGWHMDWDTWHAGSSGVPGDEV